MATNLKGQGKFASLLLLHGEKLAIAAVGLAVVWFVYKSFYVPRLGDKFQAPQLQSDISKTSAEIKEFSWTRATAEYKDKVKLAEPIAANNEMKVKSDFYETSNRIDPPVVAPMIVRTDPTLVEAVDVRATGGSGVFAFADAKIRHEQEVKLRAEADARARKEEDRLKKEALKQAKEGAAGASRGRGARGPEGPGRDLSSELSDPAHPKRRPVEGAVQKFGIPLQGFERIERAYWACVVAKVPVREQLKLYQDAFKEARGYDQARDFPRYVGYVVERSEVQAGKPLEWKRVPLYDAQHQSVVSNKPIDQTVNVLSVPKLYELAAQFWAGMSPDVIDPRYVDYVLTLPLPPLVGRDWGSEASHPDFPLGMQAATQEEVQQPVPAQAPAQTGAADENAGFSAGGPATQPGVPGGPGMPAGPGLGTSPVFRRPSIGPEGPGGPSMRAMYGPEGGGRPGGVGPEGGRPSMGGIAGPGDKNTLTPGVDFWLLRFFDYTVEPGKQYKYRVKLVLADPNAGLPANVLAPAVLDRQVKMPKDRTGQRATYRFVENWSDPSPTVGIPMGGDIRLADAKIPSAEKVNDEPAVWLLVQSFDVDEKGNAIQAGVDKRDPSHLFRRGYVANLMEDAEYLAEGGAYIDTQPNFKFSTGMMLLDIAGGAKLTKDIAEPVRILVMGPSGQLYIRNETDDKPVVENHRQVFAKNMNGGPAGPGAGGPGGPEGPIRGPRPGRTR